jgi:hypothetical protein
VQRAVSPIDLAMKKQHQLLFRLTCSGSTLAAVGKNRLPRDERA